MLGESKSFPIPRNEKGLIPLRRYKALFKENHTTRRGMAEWQTRVPQVHVGESPCGFESRRPDHSRASRPRGRAHRRRERQRRADTQRAANAGNLPSTRAAFFINARGGR